MVKYQLLSEFWQLTEWSFFCCVVKFLFFTIFPCSSTKIIVNANPLYGWIIICFSTTPVNSKFPQILKCKNYTYVRTKTCGVQYFLILLLILWYQFTEVGTSLFWNLHNIQQTRNYTKMANTYVSDTEHYDLQTHSNTHVPSSGKFLTQPHRFDDYIDTQLTTPSHINLRTYLLGVEHHFNYTSIYFQYTEATIPTVSHIDNPWCILLINI